MPWRAAMGVGTLLVVVAAACSSFSDAGDAPATPDAGAGAVEAPAPDATTAGPFCDAYRDASFCFSFDDGADPRVGAQLTLTEPNDASVSDAAVSPPNALAVEVSSQSSDNFGNPLSGVSLVPTGAGTHVHCDLEVWARHSTRGSTRPRRASTSSSCRRKTRRFSTSRSYLPMGSG